MYTTTPITLKKRLRRLAYKILAIRRLLASDMFGVLVMRRKSPSVDIVTFLPKEYKDQLAYMAEDILIDFKREIEKRKDNTNGTDVSEKV